MPDQDPPQFKGLPPEFPTEHSHHSPWTRMDNEMEFKMPIWDTPKYGQWFGGVLTDHALWCAPPRPKNYGDALKEGVRKAISKQWMDLWESVGGSRSFPLSLTDGPSALGIELYNEYQTKFNRQR